MSGELGQSLGERLEAMLREQAKANKAPEWIRELLGGNTEGTTLERQGRARLVATRPDGSRGMIEARLTFTEPPPTGRNLWRITALAERKELRGVAKADLEKLSYIVVDEIVDNDADISVSQWPRLDARGRLVFSEEPALRVRADVKKLNDFLNEVEFRWGPRWSSLRMGTVLAAEVRTESLSAKSTQRKAPSAWLVPPVWDITEPARDKAKEAFYAAVAPPLRPAEAQAIRKPPET
jgi:hypothetical protein